MDLNETPFQRAHRPRPASPDEAALAARVTRQAALLVVWRDVPADELIADLALLVARLQMAP